MMGLFSLLFALFAYLGPVDIRIVDGPVIATDASGAHEAGAKATRCIDGQARIEGTAAALADVRNLTHELLHLADCRDDGAYNGSLDPTYDASSPDQLHHYVYWALQNPDTAARQIEALPR